MTHKILAIHIGDRGKGSAISNPDTREIGKKILNILRNLTLK